VEEANYFIPNVFSPNGDGINDEVRLVVASGVAIVRRWIIFDRWGQAVFGREGFDPSDPSVFWDGRSPEGRSFNPAVFAYLLEFELTNGEVRTHYGNITILR
jgi:gliding motility-associated-like protein